MQSLQDSLSPSETVLEYVLDNSQSFCLYVTRDRAGVSLLPASRAEVGQVVAAYREEISSRLPSTTSAARLYSLLLKPLPVAVLKPELVVVPDGELNLIPFDALTDAGGKYVLASHVVSYVPSAAVLSLIRQTKRLNPGPITFLGLGGVPYRRSATGAAANAKPGGQRPADAISNPFDLRADPLPDLPNSSDKVRSAGEIFGKSSALWTGCG
jgi:CHAT domain-containing protein